VDVVAAIAPHVNKVSVMSYTGYQLDDSWASWFVSPLTGADYTTPTGERVVPMAIDDSLQSYAQHGVPKDKLLMGIGAYAICYPSYITEPRQMTITPDKDKHPGHEHDAITGGDNSFPLGDMFASGGPLDQAQASKRRFWDDVVQQPYLSLVDATSFGDLSQNQETRYIPYDDEESIVVKGKWSRDNGYGGTIVWTLPELLHHPSKTIMNGRADDALVQALRTGFLA
jgi:chitinase